MVCDVPAKAQFRVLNDAADVLEAEEGLRRRMSMK